MRTEYLINSIVYFGLYIAMYIFVFSDLLKRYDKEINGTKIFNTTYINYVLIFLLYVLLIQVFLQLFNFSKSVTTSLNQILKVVIMSVIFASFFIILYVGYVLYNKNPIYLLYLGIVLLAIPIVSFFLYKFFQIFKNNRNNRVEKTSTNSLNPETTTNATATATATSTTNATTTTKLDKSVNGKLKVNDTSEKKSFYSWFFGDGKKETLNTKIVNGKSVNTKSVNNKFKSKSTMENANSLYNRIQLELSVLPNSVKILIGAEFLLIGLYLFKKLAINSLSDLYKPKGIYLTRGKLELSKANKMGNYEEIKNKLHSKELYNYNYGLSMWLKINPKGQLNTFVNIFNYGYNPYIEYNESNNTFRVIMTDDMENQLVVYETTDFLIQRWNHVVINYYGNYFDVFINGELVATAKKIAPYLKESPLIIGSNNGLNGIVKEVSYFSKPLSLSSIRRINESFYLNENNTTIEQDFGIDIMKSMDLGIFSSITNLFNNSVKGVNNNVINPISNFFTGAGNKIADESKEVIQESKEVIEKSEDTSIMIGIKTENNYNKLSTQSKSQVNDIIKRFESETEDISYSLEESF